MAQFGRPGADTLIGNYTDEVGGTTNIYTGIDETSPEDTEYIKSPSAPSDEPYVTQLTTLEDPASSSDHVVRYRYRKSASGGSQIDLVVQIREGYTNEGSPGTLIATHSYSDISDSWVTSAETLSGGEADTITDYTDLYLRFVFDQP